MDEAPLTLLLVEDDRIDRIAFRRTLDAAGVEATVVEVSTGREALERLAAGDIDCAFLDHYLPDLDGRQVLEEVRRLDLRTPIVALTGRGDEELAVELMKAGATDYLPKSALSPDRLLRVLRYARRVLKAERLAAEADEALRRRTEQLQQALEARDSVLAVVSHDLRNPLNAVTTSLALLDHVLPDEEGTARRAVNTIRRSAQQMSRLIDDLLDAARIESGRFTIESGEVELQALLQEALEQFLPQAAERSIRLSSDGSHGPITVAGDRWRLMQVVSNLLSNAVRLTPAGGEVRIAWSAEGGGVRLSVADTGPGIPEDELPHLFQPFWQSPRTLRGGAGLGLTIVRGIVEAHGGEIRAESRQGEGSTFVIDLPGP